MGFTGWEEKQEEFLAGKQEMGRKTGWGMGILIILLILSKKIRQDLRDLQDGKNSRKRFGRKTGNT